MNNILQMNIGQMSLGFIGSYFKNSFLEGLEKKRKSNRYTLHIESEQTTTGSHTKDRSRSHTKGELENIFLEGLEENKQKLLRICSAYTNDDEEKKDLFQEVLVNIWKSMASFKGNSALSTWMYRVTLNVCINTQTKLTKKKKQFVNMDSVTMSQYEKPTNTEEENPLLPHLRSCIRSMNEADKAVITLHLEELPYKEIAEVTGLSENHVAVKIKRIKKKLLTCITSKS